MIFGRELDMTNDSHRFTPTHDILPSGDDPRDPLVARRLLEKGYLTLHEGKTFHQYDDHWGERPRYLVHVDQLADKPAWREAARYYRLAFRDIASSTNERTVIFGCLQPGQLFGNTAPCERNPQQRAAADSLVLSAIANVHTFDWTLRQKSAAHVNLFILNGCPVPALSSKARILLSHSALRLTCNHEGYDALWQEQLGNAWREPTLKHTWPVLSGDDARWAVRAAIDAVVADAYGLIRSQYEHVLSSFSHRSYPGAPELCLAAFDDLKSIGLDAFAKKHDPYWEVPLNESLPRPVIDLPGAAASVPAEASGKPYVGKGGQLELFPPDFGPLFQQSAAAATAEKARKRQRPQVAAQPRIMVPAATTDGTFEKIVALLRGQEVITSRDVQAMTGLNAAEAKPHLERLVSEGHALKEGERRGTRYKKSTHDG